MKALFSQTAVKPIGQMLRERGLVSEEDLNNALALQKERRDKLGKILVDLGYVAERDVLLVLGEQLNTPIFNGEYPAVPIATDKLPYRFLKSFHIIPVHFAENVLSIVTSDPGDFDTLSAIRLRTSATVKVFLGLESEIDEQLERPYGGEEEAQRLIETLSDPSASDEENIEHLRDLASEAPVIRMVNLIISRAIESRASDIHIEPFEKELRLRYRVDGVLQNMDPPPNALRAAIISRIKLMAKLNIAERGCRKDAATNRRRRGREIALGVSQLQPLNGEGVLWR